MINNYKKKRNINEPVVTDVFLIPNGTHGGGAPSPINVRTCLPIN